MKDIFINFTNHPSEYWDEAQKQGALEYGSIVDVPFPVVDASEDEEYIKALSERYVVEILQYHPRAVLCQGEFCVAYRVINRLKEEGITVLAACSQRCVRESGNVKEVVFSFVRFRKYE